MKNTFARLLFLIIFIFGIPSCKKDCDCCDLEPSYFNARISDFEVKRVERQVSSADWEPYQQGDTVNANGDLVIYFQSNIERLAFRHRTVNSGLFTHSAYACSPAELPRTKQEFVSLSISSNEDYDDEHPAGSELIDLFFTRGEHDGEHDQKMPLSSHLETNSDYFILHAPWVFLNKNPGKVSTHIFKFELVLSDTTLNFQTPAITLK